MAHSWGAPTLFVPKEEKYRALFVERSLPGCLVVNARGERFVNESCPYPEFQQAMYADHARSGNAIPAWIVFDADFRRKYPIGPLPPGEAVPDERLRKSWLGAVYWKDGSLDGLAAQGTLRYGMHVSETALMTLQVRASEARRPDGIIDDPVAVELVDRIDFDFAKFGYSRRPDMAMRALAFDGATKDYLRDHPKATVVALAEGFQTSYYRIEASAVSERTPPSSQYTGCQMVHTSRRWVIPQVMMKTPKASQKVDRISVSLAMVGSKVIVLAAMPVKCMPQMPSVSINVARTRRRKVKLSLGLPKAR